MSPWFDAEQILPVAQLNGTRGALADGVTEAVAGRHFSLLECAGCLYASRQINRGQKAIFSVLSASQRGCRGTAEQILPVAQLNGTRCALADGVTEAVAGRHFSLLECAGCLYASRQMPGEIGGRLPVFSTSSMGNAFLPAGRTERPTGPNDPWQDAPRVGASCRT